MGTPPGLTETDIPNDFRLDPGRDLVLVDPDGQEILRLDAGNGIITLRAANGDPVLRLAGRQGNLALGGEGIDGDLLLFASDGAVTMAAQAAAIRMNGQRAEIVAGVGNIAGAVEIRGPSNRVRLDGAAGRLEVSGPIEIRSTDGAARVRIRPNASMLVGGDGEAGSLRLRSGQGRDRIVFNANSAAGELGGEGEAGLLRIKNADDETTLLMNGDTGNLAVGGATEHGAIFVKAGSGSDADNVFVLNGERGDVILGRDGRGSDVSIRDDDGRETLLLRGKTGNIAAGRSGKPGNVFVKNDAGQNAIHLSGETGNANITGNVNVDGDVRLSRGDCAEEFPVSKLSDALPGTVMVLEPDGYVRPCGRSDDSRVAGVVSGAGCYQPAIILDSQSDTGPRVPLALSGKVFCKVDARSSPVAIGDLLTTSEVTGHARKVTDPMASFGAVLGKAMGSLDEGQGLVPILVCLA